MPRATSYTLRRSAINVKASAAVTETQVGCSKECIEEQLNKQFNQDELKKTATHNTTTTGGESYGRLDEAGDKTGLDDAAKDLGAAAQGNL